MLDVGVMEIHMESMSMADARKNFSEILHRAFYQNHITTINRHGKPVAMLVPNEYGEIILAIQKIRQVGGEDLIDNNRIVELILRGSTLVQGKNIVGDNP